MYRTIVKMNKDAQKIQDINSININSFVKVDFADDELIFQVYNYPYGINDTKSMIDYSLIYTKKIKLSECEDNALFVGYCSDNFNESDNNFCFIEKSKYDLMQVANLKSSADARNEFINILVINKNEFIVGMKVPFFSFITEKEVDEKLYSLGATDFFAAVSPEYAKSNIVRKAKNVVVSELSAHDSLTYIEGQVDLLSKLTFAMYGILTDEQKLLIANQFTAINNFKSACESNATTMVKSDQEIIDDINVSKAKVRHVQNRYREIKKSEGVIGNETIESIIDKITKGK